MICLLKFQLQQSACRDFTLCIIRCVYRAELIFYDRDPYSISKLSAKYQFCAIHTADNTDGEITGGGYYFATGYILARQRHMQIDATSVIPRKQRTRIVGF